MKVYKQFKKSFFYTSLIVIYLFLFTSFVQADEVSNYAPTCVATSVFPSELDVTYDGAQEIITVRTQNNCTGYAVTKPSWINYTKSGLKVTLTIAPNPGTARSGYVVIGGLTVTVNQEAVCEEAGPAGAITGSPSVCQEQSNVFYSITKIIDAASYQWNYSGSGATINGNSFATTINFGANATSGYLTVRGVSSCGLPGAYSQSYYINVNSLPSKPTITSIGTTSICAGNNVTLTSSPGYSYTWSNGATTQSITINTSGAYTVQTSNANGCKSAISDPVGVNVYPKPLKPSITTYGSTTFCEGGAVELVSSSGTSYLWSTGETSSSIVATRTGNYTVKVTNSYGCESVSSDPVIVTVNPKPQPTITANGPTTFCAGGSVTLTSSAGSSYKWSNGATTRSISVSSSGSFTVNVAEGTGCSNTSGIVNVTVNQPPSKPVISASGPTTICSTEEISLTSTSAQSYLWSNGATGPAMWPEVSGNYTVKVFDANGCASPVSDPVTVSIIQQPSKPTITANSSTTVCEGNSVTLTSSLGSGYRWSTGETTRSITVSTAGSYKVQTISSGCSSPLSDPITVNVNSKPSKPIISANGTTSFCAGGSVTLTATPAYSYHWSNGATTQSIVVNATGAYTVQTSNANGCKSETSDPSAISVLSKPLKPTIFAEGPTTFCEGNMVELFSSSGSSFLWSTGETSETIVVTETGTYKVKVYNSSGCASVDSDPVVVTVKPSPKPTIMANGPTTFCSGDDVLLTAPLASGYLWSNGETTNSINVNSSGNYTVQVINSECTSLLSDPITVTVNTTPAKPTIIASSSTTFWEGHSIKLTSPPESVYLWSTGETTPIISVSNSGTYSVQVTSSAGCKSPISEPLAVKVMPVPDLEHRSIDKTLPVGTTAGTPNITSTGAASYQIPIFSSPGTSGMQPVISFVYNSNSADGLLGKGWNLTGLSVISRTPQTIYHDGNVQGVELTAADRFELDGNRLLVTNKKNYGTEGAQYHTEIENFTQTTSYGIAGSGPRWFKVETKDGLTLEFGNSENSIIQAQNKDEIISWYISKITDKKGNYMTFTYHFDRMKGEFWPERIDYTANDNTGLDFYNAIVFNYLNREKGIKTDYVAGSGIIKNVLLNSVQVMNGSNMVREYQLKYEFNDKSALLDEVIEYGTDRAVYNSTVFSYYKQNFLYDIMPLGGPFGVNSSDDFNGDGKGEIIRNGQLYKLKDDETGFIITPTGISGNIETGDFNGDGKADVVLPLKNSTSAFSFHKSTGTGFTDSGNFGEGSTSEIKIFTYDFNGDDLKDVFTYNQENSTMDIYWGNSTAPFSTSSEVTISWGEKQLWADFNGNGKIELMTLDIYGYKIYEWESSGLILKNSGNGPTSKDAIFVGDYNGDGKSDFIRGLYNDSRSVFSMIKSHISNGDDFVVTSFGPNIDGDIDLDLEPFDIDGDGADEFMVYDISSRHVFKFMGYYKFDNFTYQPYFNDLFEGSVIDHNDYNGDGVMDCLFRDPNHNNDTYAFINRNGLSLNLLCTVVDGLNKKVKFEYKPISDASVPTQGASFSFPIVPSRYLTVVSSVISDNGLGGKTEINYTYEGATTHAQGKGFLGFSKITSVNNVTLVKSVITNSVNTSYYFLQPVKSEQYSNNTLISENIYTPSLKEFGDLRIFPYVSQLKTNVYDLSTRTLYNTATTSTSYDDYGNITNKVVNYNGVATTSINNVYNNFGGHCNNRLTNSTVTRTREGETSNYVSVTTFDYDPQGYLTRRTEEPDNSKQLITDYEVNEYGNVSGVEVSPDGITGRTTTTEFDEKQRFVTKQINSEGHFVSYVSDEGLGVIKEQKDHNNLSTINSYDGFGRLRETTGPDQNTSRVSLHWATESSPLYSCYYIKTESPGTSPVFEYYDNLGRSIQTERSSLDGKKVYTNTLYNNKGLVDYINLPHFAGSQPDQKVFTYDNLGRLLSETAPGVNTTYSYNGLATTITDHIAGQTYTRTTDATGNIASASDQGGDITYQYYSNGLPKQITSPGKTITMEYDHFGRQTKLSDPDAGTYNYTYTSYGELLTQTDPQGRTITLEYDDLGRLKSQTGGTFNTAYAYKPNGQLDNVASTNNITYTYGYDDLGRVESKTENISGSSFITSYGYNSDGQMSQITYPSGFKIDYFYQNGYLKEIKRNDNGTTIWTLGTVNEKDQLTGATFGNHLSTTRSYNSWGLIQTMQTGAGNTIQNLEYHFDAKGLMEWRKDNRRGLVENFGYDELNRLNSIQLGAGTANSISYAPGGNIQTKYDAGDYTYGASQPNAVTQVTNPNSLISLLPQSISYTTFDKVAVITEGTSSAAFTYGPDYQRKKVEAETYGVNTTKYYSGTYEKEIKDGVTRELHYIIAYGGIVAIFEKKSDAGTMHYVHTDHLGSLNVITDENGAIEQEMSFDAWGNRRDANTWQNLTVAPAGLITDRGFTGHEHMDAFKLINMNGRVYDPVLGRFLSPDLFVANAQSTQDFNRFSYAVNNPLKFTDPTGYYNILYAEEFDGGGGDGVFPKMGMIGSPKNDLEYDIALSQNIDAALGITSNMGALRNRIACGGYAGSGVIGSNLYKIGFASVGDVNNGSTTTTGFVYGIYGTNGDQLPYYVVSFDPGTEYLVDGNLRNGSWIMLGDYLAQGEGGNWLQTANDVSGIVTTLITAGTERANAYVRGQFKSAKSWTGWTNLRGSQQAWRTANVLGKTGAATIKITGAAGGILGGLSASYSTYKVTNQYLNGGLANVNGWDAADAAVGWAGTASAAVLLFGTTNPVGWAIIGIGAAGYGAFRAGQYIYENFY